MKENNMKRKERKILVLNFLTQGEKLESTVDVAGIVFQVVEERIGWDFANAKYLIKKFDGEVDGIVLSGLRERASFGGIEILHRQNLELIRHIDKSPVYLGSDLQLLFANWTMRRFLKDEPQFFKGKKVLFHAAVFTPFAHLFIEGGAEISGADPLFWTGTPLKLKGSFAIKAFLHALKPLVKSPFLESRFNLSEKHKGFAEIQLQKWVIKSDVFVTYAGLIRELGDLSCLKGKILVIDSLTPRLRERLIEAGVAQVIECIPDLDALNIDKINSFGLLTGIIDQVRIERNPGALFDQFALEFIEELKVVPRKAMAVSQVPRRCAFVVHPLAIKHLSYTPGFSWLRTAPKGLVDTAERAMARLPIFHYGTMTGARSDSTGQEVLCDIYALCATPKQLMRMDEEIIYTQLVRAARNAHENGALLFGLGAYTKVIGDSGVTVARRSPLPITTGNSYSAASTLWAAREMVAQMGFVQQCDTGRRLRAKAMVIGATGSIGRVSAQLLSLAFDELVLVATRPDKLLELRDEILELSPNISVVVRTNPNEELLDTDLIVTATSNQKGSILDIRMVKPGAVICDCSRPLDITKGEADKRPDVLVIESGEIDLPGNVHLPIDLGLPKPSVYACLAETVLLTMEGRYECFSLSRQLHLERVKEIYKIGLKHGAKLSAIRGHHGVVTPDHIRACRDLAREKLKSWPKMKKVVNS